MLVVAELREVRLAHLEMGDVSRPDEVAEQFHNLRQRRHESVQQQDEKDDAHALQQYPPSLSDATDATVHGREASGSYNEGPRAKNASSEDPAAAAP